MSRANVPDQTRKQSPSPGAAILMGGHEDVAERLARALVSSPDLLDLMAAAIAAGIGSGDIPISSRTTRSRKEKPSGIGGQCVHADLLVPLAAVKAITGLGKTKIYGLVRESSFPAPYKPGGIATRWSLAEVLAWRRELKPTR